MYTSDEDKNFKFAANFIKTIVLIIALLILVVSKYAFIFFSAAMLPTIVAIFSDRNNHKCISATICTFNLIGVLPYLMRLWENEAAINNIAKLIIADVDTWIVIYGAAFVGLLLYMSLPLLVIKFYSASMHVQISKALKKRKLIADEWGIPIEDMQQVDSKLQT